MANDACPELQAMPNKQRSRRWVLVFLTVWMVIISITLAGITGFIFLHYFTVSKKVSDLEKTASEFQSKVADLNNTIVKLQDTFVANVKFLNKTLESICPPCPDGMYTMGPSCYYFSEDKVCWEEARDKCYKMNSVLVMIKNKAESDTLNQLFKTNNRYWIGLRKDPTDKRWKWLDGTQVSFTKWGKDEPNNAYDIENCTEIISSFWNDFPCTETLLYICESIRTCWNPVNQAVDQLGAAKSGPGTSPRYI
ncbi:CD209 antigen-like protein C [Dendropsophus ebraccatus]|uniref:CD209 antigen-like protein C n=1 Tax=Dendropsophus ebraccatus TaxID=150705 RepID=UPI00383205F4